MFSDSRIVAIVLMSFALAACEVAVDTNKSNQATSVLGEMHFPLSQAVGACAPLTVNFKPIAAQDGEIAISGLGSGHVYSDADCSKELSSVGFHSGDSEKTFYFKDNVEEALNLSLAYEGQSYPVHVTVALETRALVISSPIPVGGTAVAGSCTAFTVGVAPAKADSLEKTVTISASAPGGTVYADQNCFQKFSETSFGSHSTAKIYVRSTLAGTSSLIISAADPHFTTANLTYKVSAGTATHLAMTSSEFIKVGRCQPVDFQLQDDFDNPAIYPQTGTFKVAAHDGFLFADDQCQVAPTAGIPAPVGTTNFRLFAKPTAEDMEILGLTLLVGAYAGLSSNAEIHFVDSLTIAYPDKLIVDAVPAALGLGMQMLTVRFADSAGNQVVLPDYTNMTVHMLSYEQGSSLVCNSPNSSCFRPTATHVANKFFGSTHFYVFQGRPADVTVQVSYVRGSGREARTIFNEPLTLKFDYQPASKVVFFDPTATADILYQPTRSTAAWNGALGETNACNLEMILPIDAAGGWVYADQSLPVDLSSKPGNTFYADSACTNAITSTAVDAGKFFKRVYFKPVSSESTPMWVNYDALGSDSRFSVLAWSGGQSFRLKVPETASVGSCVEAEVDSFQDGASGGVAQDTSIVLSFGPEVFDTASVKMYADAACSPGAIVSDRKLKLLKGDASRKFYIQATQAIGIIVGSSPWANPVYVEFRP